MIGPRNSIIRTLMGEEVPLDEWVRDQSEFVDSTTMYWNDYPELWIDRVHDSVGF